MSPKKVRRSSPIGKNSGSSALAAKVKAALKKSAAKAGSVAKSSKRASVDTSGDTQQHPDTQPGEPKKVRHAMFAVDPEDSTKVKEDVTLINGFNPVAEHGLADVDYAAREKEEQRVMLMERMRHSIVERRVESGGGGGSEKKKSVKPGGSAAAAHPPQQAFSIFNIPVVIDTRLLTVPELKVELKTRGLRIDGNKPRLVMRLDKYIQENEKELIDPSKNSK